MIVKLSILLVVKVSFHPDPFDHLPLLSLLQRRKVDFASSLYVSKLMVKAGINQSDNYYFNEIYDRGSGFQLTVDGVSGFHSSNGLDEIGEELSNLTLQLRKRSKPEKQDNHQDQIDREADEINHVDKLKIDISKNNIWTSNYREEIDNYLNDINDLVSTYKSSMKFSVDIEVYFLQKRFQSTESVDIQQEYMYSLLSLSAESKNLSKPLKRNEIIGGINKEDLKWDIVEAKTSKLASELEKLKAAPKPIRGDYKVVLSEDAVYSLIHETIGHGCEADQIISKNSFLTDKIGFKVSSSNLTIVDDPHIRSVGWGEYDDEGIKTQGTLLVDEGILSSYLHNKETAKHMGELSTGNARATTYLSPPEPRQSNIYIEPGDNSTQELIEEVGTGLFIGPSLVASTSIYTGEFSIESQITYEIKNGEIQNVLGPVTLTGNALTTLNELSSIGSRPEMIPTICLKNDSLVFVGSLMPQLTLNKIAVY
ncbi:MAG: TldD/PmbA family protein [Candidatus Heimdallarchaeota archaeon]|nr:TldD/PmbA family protein [Candidatus Heimdallarchaeota archaeon]